MRLELTLSDFATGSYGSDITLMTNCAETPILRIPLRFRVEPRIKAVPAALCFGAVASGTTVRRTILLGSDGILPFSATIETAPDLCKTKLSTNGRELSVEACLTTLGLWEEPIVLRVITGESKETIRIECTAYVTP